MRYVKYLVSGFLFILLISGFLLFSFYFLGKWASIFVFGYLCCLIGQIIDKGLKE